MSQKKEKLTVFILFVIGFAIRLAFISQKNLWFDEVFSWNLSIDSFYSIIIRTSADIHPPLYYFLLKIWIFIFGDTAAAMRLLSAIFTSSAVFFIYPLCRRYMDLPQTIMVILLYIFSPLNIYYSQEVRMAGMNLFWNLGSVYFLLKLMDKPHDYHSIFRQKYSVTFILFTAAAIYTHYFSFFIITAELIYIIYTYRNSRKHYLSYLLIYSAVLFIYIPWIQELITHFSRGQSWRSPQGLNEVLQEYINYTRDLNFGLYYYYTNLNLVKIVTYFTGFAVIISSIGLFIRKKAETNKPLLLLLVFFIPLILAGIISFRQRIEFYRYLSILVPYISFFLIYGLGKWNKKYIIYPIVLIILSINIYGISIYYSFDFKNDDYRELINKISTEYKPGDRIYVEPHFNGWTINYYKKQNGLIIPDPVKLRYGWNELLDSLNTQKPDRFWLVMDYSAVDTSDYNIKINAIKQNFRQDDRTTYFLAPSKVELYRFSNHNY